MLTHRVVVNHEEQYSIWPTNMKLPAGWDPEGFEGSRQECLARIDQVWTDMRPASVRRLVDASRP
ncbi:MbtH family protein [Streptomyces capitiformicae]|uniref:MbtH family protein n=1 Tax=Streptomyces capitiformicae TaxID=2014920 RepID=UPI001E30E899|nr:MbtH family NRPS accessory protein [Streptomyces capitiformicae]